MTRTEIDGSITVLADRYDGKRLNAPNDVVVKSDGSVWFSDPTYGILSDYGEQGRTRCCRTAASSGSIRKAVRSRPSSTTFSSPMALPSHPTKNASTLPIPRRAMTRRRRAAIRVFDVVDGSRLKNGRVFCNLDSGIPDGFHVDTLGNVWTSAGDGVHCFAPDGTLLGKILVPQTVANLTFGGPRRNRLFITATRSLYAVYTTATGAQYP